MGHCSIQVSLVVLMVLYDNDDGGDDGDFEDDHEDGDDLHQVSGSTMVLTGGQLHPSLVTEYSGIDNGWQVMLKIILTITLISR